VKIVTIHFEEDYNDFSNLLKVWEYSARLHHPDAEVVVLTVPRPEEVSRKCDPFLTFSSSYAFLEMARWALTQNDEIIMTDADLMFTGDCSPAFKEDFTLGVTVRKARGWLNAGVLFYRPAGRGILKSIIRMTETIVSNPELFVEHVSECLGGDQTAITLHALNDNSIKRFSCSEYNLEQNSWEWFSENTKIVHMKSNLWDMVQGLEPRRPVPEDHVTHRIFEIWKGYLREAGCDEGSE